MWLLIILSVLAFAQDREFFYVAYPVNDISPHGWKGVLAFYANETGFYEISDNGNLIVPVEPFQVPRVGIHDNSSLHRCERIFVYCVDYRRYNPYNASSFTYITSGTGTIVIPNIFSFSNDAIINNVNVTAVSNISFSFMSWLGGTKESNYYYWPNHGFILKTRGSEHRVVYGTILNYTITNTTRFFVFRQYVRNTPMFATLQIDVIPSNNLADHANRPPTRVFEMYINEYGNDVQKLVEPAGSFGLQPINNRRDLGNSSFFVSILGFSYPFSGVFFYNSRPSFQSRVINTDPPQVRIIGHSLYHRGASIPNISSDGTGIIELNWGFTDNLAEYYPTYNPQTQSIIVRVRSPGLVLVYVDNTMFNTPPEKIQKVNFIPYSFYTNHSKIIISSFYNMTGMAFPFSNVNFSPNPLLSFSSHTPIPNFIYTEGFYLPYINIQSQDNTNEQSLYNTSDLSPGRYWFSHSPYNTHISIIHTLLSPARLIDITLSSFTSSSISNTNYIGLFNPSIRNLYNLPDEYIIWNRSTFIRGNTNHFFGSWSVRQSAISVISNEIISFFPSGPVFITANNTVAHVISNTPYVILPSINELLVPSNVQISHHIYDNSRKLLILFTNETVNIINGSLVTSSVSNDFERIYSIEEKDYGLYYNTFTGVFRVNQVIIFNYNIFNNIINSTTRLDGVSRGCFEPFSRCEISNFPLAIVNNTTAIHLYRTQNPPNIFTINQNRNNHTCYSYLYDLIFRFGNVSFSYPVYSIKNIDEAFPFVTPINNTFIIFSLSQAPVVFECGFTINSTHIVFSRSNNFSMVLNNTVINATIIYQSPLINLSSNQFFSNSNGFLNITVFTASGRNIIHENYTANTFRSFSSCVLQVNFSSMREIRGLNTVQLSVYDLYSSPILHRQPYGFIENLFNFSFNPLCTNPNVFNFTAIRLINNQTINLGQNPNLSSLDIGVYRIEVRTNINGQNISYILSSNYFHIINQSSLTSWSPSLVDSPSDILFSHPNYSITVLSVNSSHAILRFTANEGIFTKSYTDTIQHNVTILNYSVSINTSGPLLLFNGSSLSFSGSISSNGPINNSFIEIYLEGILLRNISINNTFTLSIPVDDRFLMRENVTLNTFFNGKLRDIKTQQVYYFNTSYIQFRTNYSLTFYRDPSDIFVIYPYKPVTINSCNATHCSLLFGSLSIGTYRHNLNYVGNIIERIELPDYAIGSQFNWKIIADGPINVSIDGVSNLYQPNITNTYIFNGSSPYNLTFIFQNSTSFITRTIELIPFSLSRVNISYRQYVTPSHPPVLNVSMPYPYNWSYYYDNSNYYLTIKYGNYIILTTNFSYFFYEPSVNIEYPIDPNTFYNQIELPIYIYSNIPINHTTIRVNGQTRTNNNHSTLHLYIFNLSVGNNTVNVSVIDINGQSYQINRIINVRKRFPLLNVHSSYNKIIIQNFDTLTVPLRINPNFNLTSGSSFIYNFTGGFISLYFYNGTGWELFGSYGHPNFVISFPVFSNITINISLNQTYEFTCNISLSRGMYSITLRNNTLLLNGNILNFTPVNITSNDPHYYYSFKNNLEGSLSPIYIIGIIQPAINNSIQCASISGENYRICTYNQNTRIQPDSFVYIITRNGVYTANVDDDGGEILASPYVCHYTYDFPTQFFSRLCHYINSTHVRIETNPRLNENITLFIYRNSSLINTTTVQQGIIFVGNSDYVDAYVIKNNIRLFVCRATREIKFPYLENFNLPVENKVYNLLLLGLVLLLSFYSTDKLTVTLPIVAILTVFSLTDIITTSILVALMIVSYTVSAGFKSPFISNWIRDVWLVRTYFIIATGFLSMLLLTINFPSFDQYPALRDLRTEYEKLFNDMNRMITAFLTTDLLNAAAYSFMFIISLASYIFKYIYTAIMIYPILLANIHPLLAAIYNIVIIIIFIFFGIRIIMYTGSILSTPSSTLRELK